ncbi:MAG TPA: LptA/OstA family protein [Chthoniobacterales bacterium]
MGNKIHILLFAAVLLFVAGGGDVDAQTTESAALPAAASSGAKKDAGLNFLGGSSEKSKGPTIINATNEATFNSKTHTAVFTGSVQVQDPQFSLRCDELTVYLNDNEQGGLKEAVAAGNVYIISIRKGQNGAPDEKSTGRGERAVYTTADGKMVLSGGMPQIQQGLNLHVATEPGTVMELYRDGRLQTRGATRTIIQNSNAPKGASSPNASNNAPR